MPGGSPRPIDIEKKYLDRLLENGWSKADLRRLSDALFAFRWIIDNKRVGGLNLDEYMWTSQFGLNDSSAYFAPSHLHHTSRFTMSAKNRVTAAIHLLCQWGIIVSHTAQKIPLEFLRHVPYRPEQIVFLTREYSFVADAISLQSQWLEYWCASKIDSLSQIIAFPCSKTALDLL